MLVHPEDPQFLELAKSVLTNHQRGWSSSDNNGTEAQAENHVDDRQPMLGTPEEIAEAVDTAVNNLYFDWEEPTYPGIKLELI